VRPRLALTVAILPVALTACGGSSQGGSASPPPATEARTAPAPAAKDVAGGCKQVDAPKPGKDGTLKPPKAGLDPNAGYSATVKTNCGRFTFKLDLDAAPKAAASFAALAKQSFFDGTVFHRIAPGFVIQGGDPTGTGSGGPGYSTKDTPPSNASYTKGVVAMAKSADEAPGTAGSQFFVVTGQDTGLPADYAVLGKVTDGLDVVQRIGRLGDSAEQPTETVLIQDVTVTKR